MNIHTTQKTLIKELLQSGFNATDTQNKEHHFYELTQEELFHMVEDLNAEALHGNVTYQLGQEDEMCFTINATGEAVPSTIYIHDLTLQPILEKIFSITFSFLASTLLPARADYVILLEKGSRSRTGVSPRPHIRMFENDTIINLIANTEQEFMAGICFISQLAAHTSITHAPFQWLNAGTVPQKGVTSGLLSCSTDYRLFQWFVHSADKSDREPFCLFFYLGDSVANCLQNTYPSMHKATSEELLTALRKITRKSRIADAMAAV